MFYAVHYPPKDTPIYKGFASKKERDKFVNETPSAFSVTAKDFNQMVKDKGKINSPAGHNTQKGTK